MTTAEHRVGSGATSAPGKYVGIQFLRLLASVMVMLHHSTWFVSQTLPHAEVWEGGVQGVPIFFVVSGFVMALTTPPLLTRDHGARHFILARLIRVAPLYWTLTIVKLALVARSTPITSTVAAHVLVSMLFVFGRDADGAVEAFYRPGWTLNFEMFFYALFALALRFHLKIIPFIGSVLLAVSVLSLLRADSWPSPTYLCNALALNFLWGMLIAELASARLRVPALLSSALVVSSLVTILAFPEAKLLGAQYAALVAGTVLLEEYVAPRLPRILILGGDASYSLYLVHPMVGVVVSTLLRKLQVTSAALSLAVVIAYCLAAAAVTYRYFELPVTQYLRRHLMPRMSVPALEPSSAAARN